MTRPDEHGQLRDRYKPSSKGTSRSAVGNTSKSMPKIAVAIMVMLPYNANR